MADIFPGFQQGAVCYDREAKEIVKLTNFRCALDHSNPAAFAASHARADGSRGCTMLACEAVALRVIGVDSRGKARVAFTYRQVKPEMLSAAEAGAWLGDKLRPRITRV